MNELKKTVISAVVVFLALVASCGWAYTGWKTCKTTEASVETKKAQVVVLREKIARIPALRQEKSRLQNELTEYETILPNNRELDKIFDTLSDFTKDSGVVITQFKPERERAASASAPQSSYQQVSYDLKLDGDFFQLTKFINLLENYKRFVRVDSFEMGTQNLGEPLRETTLKVSTFLYDPKVKTVRKRPARASNRRKRVAGPKPIPFDLAEEATKQYVVLTSQSGIGRRNPFTNPLTRRHAEGPDKALIAKRRRKLTPAEEQQLIKTIQKQVSVVTGLIRGGDFDKATEIFAEVQDNLTHQFVDPAATSQIAMVRARAAEVGQLLETGRGKKLHEMVTTQYQKMKEAFDVADYEGVAKIHLATVDMLKKAEGIDYDGLDEVTGAVTRLAERARTCAEFAGLDINVQGVLWVGDGRAAAIINKQSLIQGDKLRFDEAGGKRTTQSQTDADVFVHMISQEKITFRYKGERIDKTLIE